MKDLTQGSVTCLRQGYGTAGPTVLNTRGASWTPTSLMKDLTTGSVTRHLVHMSAFLAMSMAVQTLYLLADL